MAYLTLYRSSDNVWYGGMASDSLRRNRIKELTLPVRHEWLVRE